MKVTVIGVYATDDQAINAAALLKKSGFLSKQIFSVTDTKVLEDNVAPTGIFLGGIIGIIAGYAIFLITGFNALTLSNGFGPFLWTIVIVGVIGAIAGGFLGSFVSFGISEDLNMYHAYLDEGASMVSIQCEKKEEEKVFMLLQKTGAKKIQTITKERSPRIIPTYSPQLAYAGIKGGSAKRIKKKTLKRKSSSRG